MKPISIPRKNFSISRISKQIQQLHWYKILKNLKSQWFCWLVNTQLVKRHSSNIFSNQSSPECESVPSQPPTVSSLFHKETKMKLQARYQKVLYLVMPLLLTEQSHSELFRLLVMHFFQGKLHYIISYNLYVLISKFSKDCNVPKWRIKYSNQFQSSIPLVFYLEKNKESIVDTISPRFIFFFLVFSNFVFTLGSDMVCRKSRQNLTPFRRT